MNNNFKYDIAKGFQRTNDFPLDKSSIFTSLQAAKDYVEKKGPLGRTSYLGQILAVVENGEIHVYAIGLNREDQTTWELQELGGILDREVTIGNVTIPPGTPIADVLEMLDEIITTSEPIRIDDDTSVPAGTTINEALQIIVEELLEKISGAGIKPGDLVGDGDIYVENGSVVKIGINGISNPDVIVLDKDRYITLEFLGGSVEPITASSVTNDVEFEEVIPDTVPSGGVWKVKDKDSRLTTYRIYDNGNPPSETLFFEPGYKIKIDGLNQIDDEEITITFEKV